MNFLRILFPALMVLGAIGSLAISLLEGEGTTSLQWLGAGLLYTALMLRNMRH